MRRYTAGEMTRLATTESQTDWDRVRNMTEAEMEEAIASDEDRRDVPRD